MKQNKIHKSDNNINTRTQEFLKSVLSFMEIREILRVQCKLYTDYIRNYQVPMF